MNINHFFAPNNLTQDIRRTKSYSQNFRQHYLGLSAVAPTANNHHRDNFIDLSNYSNHFNQAANKTDSTVTKGSPTRYEYSSPTYLGYASPAFYDSSLSPAPNANAKSLNATYPVSKSSFGMVSSPVNNNNNAAAAVSSYVPSKSPLGNYQQPTNSSSQQAPTPSPRKPIHSPLNFISRGFNYFSASSPSPDSNNSAAINGNSVTKKWEQCQQQPKKQIQHDKQPKTELISSKLFFSSSSSSMAGKWEIFTKNLNLYCLYFLLGIEIFSFFSPKNSKFIFVKFEL